MWLVMVRRSKNSDNFLLESARKLREKLNCSPSLLTKATVCFALLEHWTEIIHHRAKTRPCASSPTYFKLSRFPFLFRVLGTLTLNFLAPGRSIYIFKFSLSYQAKFYLSPASWLLMQWINKKPSLTSTSCTVEPSNDKPKSTVLSMPQIISNWEATCCVTLYFCIAWSCLTIAVSIPCTWSSWR